MTERPGPDEVIELGPVTLRRYARTTWTTWSGR